MITLEMRKVNCYALQGRSGCGVRKPIAFSRLSCVSFAYLCMVCFGLELWCSPQRPGPACDAQSVFRLADAELKRQQFNQAERELDRLLRIVRLCLQSTTFNLGWLYGRAHNFRKALTEFNSVSPDVPNTKTHQYAIALAEFELVDYKAAVETLTSTEKTGPGRGIG